MATLNHYQTLEVSPAATQTEIKHAYRRLAKLFHPDSNQTTSNHDKIARINAAYEILGDPERRRSYDQERAYYSRLESAGFSSERSSRQERTAAAQARYRQDQKTSQQADSDLQLWLKQVYTPVTRWLNQILKSLKAQIDDLSADPFDDELMDAFQTYLEECRALLSRAEKSFKSRPNPSRAAKAAANLYFCMNQIGDGIEQLEQFTLNYDDQYLHTGQELFRIAAGLRREAQAAVREIQA